MLIWKMTVKTVRVCVCVQWSYSSKQKLLPHTYINTYNFKWTVLQSDARK